MRQPRQRWVSAAARLCAALALVLSAPLAVAAQTDSVGLNGEEGESSSLDVPDELLADAGASAERPPVPDQVRRPRLIFVDPEREDLLGMLELQLPDWGVRHVAAEPTYLRVRRAQAQLMPADAVVWIERRDDIERVALLDGAGRSPRTSSLPISSGGDWSRAFALVVEGLIREQAIANSETTAPLGCVESGAGLDDDFDWAPTERRRRRAPAEEPRQSGWRTPLSRDGFLFRFGWSHGFTPRRDGSFGVYDFPSGGLRLAVGRWLHKLVRVSLIGEVGAARRAPEYVLGLQLMGLSTSRVRFGGGAELAVLRVGEEDSFGNNGWFGYRFGLPMEIGVEINRRGGFFVTVGPTWTKTPYASLHPGYQMSVEWEFQ